MNEDLELAPDVARAIPNTSVFPNLTNQDPYKQYRFGLAIAGALADEPYDPTTEWGEKMIVSAYTDGDKEIIDKAAKIAHQPKTDTSTSSKSEEAKDVYATSPVAKPKKNKYGV